MTFIDTLSRISRSPLVDTTALLGIGLATPPALDQQHITEHAAAVCCETDEQRALLRRIFGNAGVHRRGSILEQRELTTDNEGMRSFFHAPTSTDDRGPTTAARMQRYAIGAPLLAADACNRAIVAASITTNEITHLIVVSCTGFMSPGVDAALIASLGLSPSVQRTIVGFMGCHAAFNALNVAGAIVARQPDAKVLVCCVELCTLHFAYGADATNMVSNSLFGDGAAATIVGRAGTAESPGIWRLKQFASQLLPDTKQAMTWRIGDHGFEMFLAAGVPRAIEDHLQPWCDDWLNDEGLSIADVASWAIHPGGPRIVDAAVRSLKIDPAHAQPSRDILANHGNMSSATILFVLAELAKRNAHGPCVALGFGPGLMFEGMLLERH